MQCTHSCSASIHAVHPLMQCTHSCSAPTHSMHPPTQCTHPLSAPTHSVPPLMKGTHSCNASTQAVHPLMQCTHSVHPLVQCTHSCSAPTYAQPPLMQCTQVYLHSDPNNKSFIFSEETRDLKTRTLLFTFDKSEISKVLYYIDFPVAEVSVSHKLHYFCVVTGVYTVTTQYSAVLLLYYCRCLYVTLQYPAVLLLYYYRC